MLAWFMYTSKASRQGLFEISASVSPTNSENDRDSVTVKLSLVDRYEFIW